MSKGRLRLPYPKDGLYQFDPPCAFSARNAVTLGEALDGSLSDSTKMLKRLHFDMGHSSAQKLRRVVADSSGETVGSVNYVYEVSERSTICRAFDKAPHIPTAGASMVSTFNRT